jgi:hypothetical protein
MKSFGSDPRIYWQKLPFWLSLFWSVRTERLGIFLLYDGQPVIDLVFHRRKK